MAFLDLELSLHGDGSLTHEMHRKAMDAYLYLPAGSCHPISCKAGIIKSETHRIQRTCGAQAAQFRHRSILTEALRKRGYRRSFIHKVMRGALLAKNSRILVQNSKLSSDKPRFFGMKVTFSSGTDLHFIRKALKRHQHVLAGCTVGLVPRIQPSIFRALYKVTWQSPCTVQNHTARTRAGGHGGFSFKSPHA